jgi:3-hydroxyisobutyrate dehydrogenase
MEKIGFIGTGVMGRPMAVNLLRRGYQLGIVRRHPERDAVLVELGVTVADTPRELAAASEVVILMLPDTQAVEQVLFGEDGLASGAKPGTIAIDMSTISPTKTVEYAKRLAGGRCAMLDAPVSGGEKGAIEATLGIMVGGARETFEQCLGIFEAIGRTITYTGPSGCGQKTKMVNQLVAATNLLAAVEGLRLARAAGLDAETTLKAVASGAAASWMLVNLGPKMLAGDFAPGFSLRLQYKDVSLLSEWIASLGGEYPAAELINSVYRRALEAGLGEQGNQGLINLWEA